MNGLAYRVSGGTAEAVPVEAALTCDDALVWVHLNSTAEEASGWLRDQAKLDEHVVEALTATETRPRCEEFAAGALVNLRGRAKEELSQSDPLASVRIWATKGRVFSTSRAHLVATDTVAASMKAGTIRDPGDLIAAFATAITADLDPLVAGLGDSLDDCEEQLSADRIFDLRRNVSAVRVRAIGYRRFLNPQRAALEKLGALPGDWLEADDRVHLAAAADRAARMAEELESIRERSAVMHDTLSDLRAEQLDSRSLVISIVAMIFLPLTFITGLYGMNVKGLPWAENPFAFQWIALGCLTLAVGVIAFFVRRHWFRG
ncbi:CorA family divalent cation transporter [Sphingomonas sp.]|jgi:zinc transporter|uniref:CorA family divalent cation transporter n=1 Tax=Sphingomonas sp. TaxID=28214 RepID=UPI002D805760|nr:CorA family divalent cation transporter [Sphingomonas sp.]HEU0043254.1 CorA family divalent cation transporter [Sphingomonas sp.]